MEKKGGKNLDLMLKGGCYPENIFLNQKNLKKFICQIDKKIVRTPILDNCGHTFGKNCFEDWVKKCEVCPITGEQLQSREFKNNLAIEEFMEDLEVRCITFEDGCEWSGELRELELHLENDCQNAKCLCSNEECLEWIKRKDLQKHLDIECKYQRIDCYFKNNGCKERIQRSRLMEHLMKSHKDEILQTFEENKQQMIEIERLKSKCKLLEQQVEKERSEREELLKRQDSMQEELNQLSELNDQYLLQIQNYENSQKLGERIQSLNADQSQQQHQQLKLEQQSSKEQQQQQLKQEQQQQSLKQEQQQLKQEQQSQKEQEQQQQELFVSIFKESLMLDEPVIAAPQKNLENKIKAEQPLFEQFPYVEEKFVQDDANKQQSYKQQQDNMTPWLNVQTRSCLPQKEEQRLDLSSFENYQQQQERLIREKLKQEKERSQMLSSYSQFYVQGQPNMVQSMMPMAQSQYQSQYQSQMQRSSIAPQQQQFNYPSLGNETEKEAKILKGHSGQINKLI